MLGPLGLDAVFQMGPHEGGVGRYGPLFLPVGHLSFDAAQAIVGFAAKKAGSCPAFHPPEPTSPSPQGCSQGVLLLEFFCTHIWDRLNAGVAWSY